MAKIELKQPIVEEISALVKDAATVVIVSYSGITVAQDTQLRRQLREAGVSYKVYKNTLMTRAFKGSAFEGLTDRVQMRLRYVRMMRQLRQELSASLLRSVRHL